MIFKPSNLFKAKEIYKHLTRQNDTTKQFLKLGTKDIPIPPKKQNVIDIEAVNRFVKDNSRVDTTDIQPVVKQSTIKQSNVSEANEGVIQGAFDTATVAAREGGYPPPTYEAFKKRYLKRNMKADGGRIGYKDGPKLTDFVDVQASGSITGKNQIEGAPDGITANNQLINAIIRLDIPLSEKTNFLADYSYGKGRTKYEEGDKELFLDEGGYTDRNVGFGFNQDGEGFGGSVMRNLRTGDDDVKLKFKKTIDFNRLFKADGGMLVQPSDDGSRPGYAGRPLYKNQKTIQKKQDGVLTYAKRGAPIKYYDPKEYGSEAKAFKAAKADVEASQVSKKTANIKNIDIEKVKELRAKGMSIKKIADELGVEQRTISDRLKKIGESTKDLSIRGPIPKEIQKDIKAKYSSVKNWNFNKFTYGISPTSDIKLYEKILNFVAEPKPYEIAGDFSKADGWLAAQMNRSYKLGNKNYTPIKAMVNYKNKIIGFIDNTEFGGGGKYIVNEKFIKGKNADGVLMSLHPDYKNTAKFVDISKKAKLPVEGVLKDLLKNQGIDTTRISLSDLFKYMKGEVGIEGTKSALEKHHISGVKNRATGNYQLLDRDLNILARNVETEIRANDLSRVGELKKRGVMVEVGGQTYGSGPKTPGGQLKRFEKKITNFFQNDPNSKKIIKNLIASFGGGACSVFSGKKAEGGRIGLATGTPNIDDCFKSGRAVINSGKIPVDKADDFVQFLKRAGSLGRNIMRIGIIPEALYVAADSLLRVGMGDTFKEAGLRASDWFLPGDQVKIAEMSKVERIFGQNKAKLVGRAIDYKNQLSEIEGLEKTKTNLELLSGDGGAFDIIGDTTKESSNIGKQILQKKNELNNKFKISEAELKFAENIQDEAYDASKANSLFTKLKAKLRDVGQDQSDIETVGMPEKSQLDLNLRMIPFDFRSSMLNPESRANLDFSKTSDEEIKKYLTSIGELEELPEYLADKKRLQSAFSFPVLEKKFGKAQLYGTQENFFGEPILPTVPRVENSIEDLEREAVGQKNKFNIFNRDTSNLGTGLRGFSAASGGIASLTKTIPPKSGPTPQGLPYVYNSVKKI